MIVYLGHTAHINGNENLKIDFNSMDLNNDSDILFQCLMLNAYESLDKRNKMRFSTKFIPLHEERRIKMEQKKKTKR